MIIILYISDVTYFVLLWKCWIVQQEASDRHHSTRFKWFLLRLSGSTDSLFNKGATCTVEAEVQFPKRSTNFSVWKYYQLDQTSIELPTKYKKNNHALVGLERSQIITAEVFKTLVESRNNFYSWNVKSQIEK